MRSLFALTLLVSLAGRAAVALNIVFGGKLGNITASQLLDIPDGPVKTDCLARCEPATNIVQTCGDTNDACLCSNMTVTAIQDCEQCMFSAAVNRNIPMPDPRAGSKPGLTAYGAACKASTINVTLPASAITLRLPQGWDGPASLPLSPAVTALAVMTGAILGGGSLLILSTM